MKNDLNISLIGSLIGDPTRANILSALLGGGALTATELSIIIGTTVQTVTAHLAKLADGGLIRIRKRGRCCYSELCDDVPEMLGNIMSFAICKGHTRYRPEPKDNAMRTARVCYDHLAGEYGVSLLASLRKNHFITEQDNAISLTPAGYNFVIDFGIDLESLNKKRRPLCSACLDWSARRNHLAGALGAAFLDKFIDMEWIEKDKTSRALIISEYGQYKFSSIFTTDISFN